ncbi:LuxR C-terminal-related transcriptional regulator [Acetobacterium tundrae]|nr:LuxR C-terminal-related transcriptional regulator [Acetobacterium tundrae]
MENHILSTRMKIPQPRKNYIVRQPLFKKMEKMKSCGLTVIKGGAGSGKTTLLSSFIKEKSLTQIKWISLDESCNHLFLFWNYIIEALVEFMDSTRDDFLAFFNASLSKESLDQMLTLVINNLDEKEEIYLVLDDFHLINDEAILASFEFFINHAPQNLHTILLTRQEPVFYLAGLGMDGNLLFIDDRDLYISKEEGLLFLKKTMALTFDEETLKVMTGFSEGWIGGLQLIAGASFGKNESEIGSLKLTNRLISEYLTREIIDPMTKEEQEFLVCTSPFAYFSKEIANELLDNCEFDKILESLQEKNLLISCIDEEHDYYRYHHLLQEYLRNRFNRLPQEKRRKIRETSADVFKEMGDNEECLNQLLELKSYQKAMDLILQMPQNAGTFSYLNRVPVASATENFDFAYQKLFYHYGNLEFEKCQEIFTLASLKMSSDPNFDAFKGIEVLVFDNRIDLKMKLMNEVEIDQLNLNSTTKALIMIKNAQFFYYQSQCQVSLKLIDKAESYPQVDKNPYINLFSLSTKAQIYEELGYINEAFSLYRREKQLLDNNRGLSALYPSYLIGITGVYLKQMRLEEAFECLDKMTGMHMDDAGWYDRGREYNLAEYYFLMGQVDEAMALLEKILTFDIYYDRLTIASLLKYALKFSRLSEGIKNEFMEAYHNTENWNLNLDCQLLYTRLLKKQGEIASGMAFLNELLAYARKEKSYFKIIEGDLLKLSMLIEMAGDEREIVNLIKEAIYYAHQNEILLPFFYEKEVMILLDKRYHIKILPLLSKAERAFYLAMLKLCEENNACPLSERELEVLHELAKGDSNKEIAEQLCISIATVKTHMINIYGKLQVNSRISAVELSRKKGFI